MVVWGGLGCFGVVWGVSTDRVTCTPPCRAELAACCYVCFRASPLWFFSLGTPAPLHTNKNRLWPLRWHDASIA